MYVANFNSGLLSETINSRNQGCVHPRLVLGDLLLKVKVTGA